MIEVLKRYLKSKFEYELEDYALYEISRGRSKVVLISFALFAVALLLYILDVFNVFDGIMSLGLLFALLFILVVVPLALTKSTYEAIIVTPKYLIQRVSKSEFEVVAFDKVSHFQVTGEGIVIKENKQKVVLSTDLFREEVEPIIEILEAKGKTFDKEKDFMIRPIKILINDNKISIEDDEDETETDRIYTRFSEEFKTLTPGFFSEVIFRNSLVEDVLYDKGNVFLYLNSIEVKGGHPENTTFDTLQAVDCILIFQKLKFSEFFIQNLNSKEQTETSLEDDLEGSLDYLNKATINEWKETGNEIIMSFASGVNMLKTKFTVDEVLIGWNKTK